MSDGPAFHEPIPGFHAVSKGVVQKGDAPGHPFRGNQFAVGDSVKVLPATTAGRVQSGKVVGHHQEGRQLHVELADGSRTTVPAFRVEHDVRH